MEDITNGIDGIPPAKVIAEVHKQLITGFHPAVKTVAECGANLQRAFQNLHKSADAYIKAIEILAKSGEKAFLEGKRKATELEVIASTMRNINDHHQKNIKKFNNLLTKLTENCRDEKDELKERSHNYENKEKAIKKADKIALEKFYNTEMDSALMEQSQRYKFVTDYHRNWLKSYVELLKYINELVPNPPSGDNESKVVSSPDPVQEAKNPTSTESFAENHKTEVEVIVNENAVLEVPIINEDTDLCKPTPSQVDSDDFKWMTVTNEDDEVKHQETSSYFQNLKELTPLSDDDGTLENFLLTSPVELSPSTEKRPFTPPPRKALIINGNIVNGANRTNSPIQSTGVDNTQEYENYKYRVSDSVDEIKIKPKNRIHSMIDRPIQPKPATRHSQYIDKQPYVGKAEDRSASNPNDVIYRLSNINAIPTAIIPKIFSDADNGRLLVCKREFHGQTASQLSLNVGDRIVLMKSGSKGWIFAKNVETQRTGWFPSRFVEMLPDGPE